MAGVPALLSPVAHFQSIEEPRLSRANPTPAIGFVSLGCPKATVDSECILTQLRAEGYAISPTYADADLVIVNTCGFIDAAVAESLEAIGEALTENGRVIVTGCLGARAELVWQAHPNVSALTGPEPRPRLIDRCLVAAYDAGLEPLLLLTKADLIDADAFLEDYAPLHVPYLVTARTSDGFTGLEALLERLEGRVSVLVGHSGVGKSTIVNALVPEANRSTGVVNDVTGRGRHTSTSAVALPLPEDSGWVVDTPGVRSFGLAHVEPHMIVSHFSDLEPGTEACPRGCTHDEQECGLDAFVASGAAGTAGAARLASLRRLLRARSGEPE